jgi:hypothetical protein
MVSLAVSKIAVPSVATAIELAVGAVLSIRIVALTADERLLNASAA